MSPLGTAIIPDTGAIVIDRIITGLLIIGRIIMADIAGIMLQDVGTTVRGAIIHADGITLQDVGTIVRGPITQDGIIPAGATGTTVAGRLRAGRP